MDHAWWKAVILGVVEGVTEFLPISSTGHLIVAREALRFSDPHGVFTVVIQLGAILAVLAYFLRRFARLGVSLVRREPEGWHFALSIIVATAPAAVIGLAFESIIEAHLMHVGVVALTLAVGGLAILLIERGQRKWMHDNAWHLPLRIALLIGCCQLLALIPGVSRSGATILGAILLGCSRTAATEFSFFLAIPVMLGASLLKLVKYREHLDDQIVAILIGFVVAFIVALVTIHWLLRYVATHDFRGFGWYRLVAGLMLAALAAGGIIDAGTAHEPDPAPSAGMTSPEIPHADRP